MDDLDLQRVKGQLKHLGSSRLLVLRGKMAGEGRGGARSYQHFRVEGVAEEMYFLLNHFGNEGVSKKKESLAQTRMRGKVEGLRQGGTG